MFCDYQRCALHTLRVCISGDVLFNIMHSNCTCLMVHHFMLTKMMLLKFLHPAALQPNNSVSEDRNLPQTDGSKANGPLSLLQ